MIKIANVTGYDPRTNLLSATLSNSFTGINAIARLVSDRRQLQSGNYKSLLKEYYKTITPAKPNKKTEIISEVKRLASYDKSANIVPMEQVSGLIMDTYV